MIQIPEPLNYTLANSCQNCIHEEYAPPNRSYQLYCAKYKVGVHDYTICDSYKNIAD